MSATTDATTPTTFPSLNRVLLMGHLSRKQQGDFVVTTRRHDLGGEIEDVHALELPNSLPYASAKAAEKAANGGNPIVIVEGQIIFSRGQAVILVERVTPVVS